MYAGLALTVAATGLPLVDMVTVDSLAAHVRDAYPQWPTQLVNGDRNAIVIYLSAVGVLGLAGWLWAIRSVLTRKRNARRVTTVMFTLGTSVALFDLVFTGGQYDRVLPSLYGIVGLLPSLAGLVAARSVRRLPVRYDAGGSAT
jgi:hypothetical protein